jgi:hypothetical protein
MYAVGYYRTGGQQSPGVFPGWSAILGQWGRVLILEGIDDKAKHHAVMHIWNPDVRRFVSSVALARDSPLPAQAPSRLETAPSPDPPFAAPIRSMAPPLVVSAPEPPASAGRVRYLWLAFALVVLFGVAVAEYGTIRTQSRDTPLASPFGLQAVERAGIVEVSWNDALAHITQSRSVQLIVLDGNLPPLVLHRGPPTVNKFFYRRRMDDVTFLLSVESNNGKTTLERTSLALPSRGRSPAP